MILIWYTNVHTFLSFISSVELNHDCTIKIITQSMVYVVLNRAPIPHPALAVPLFFSQSIKFQVALWRLIFYLQM